MKISQLTRGQRSIVAANGGLERYLQSLSVGRQATPHSWLFEKEDAETTLARWLDVLKQLESGSQVEQKIYQFDIKQVSKFGQQGEVPPIAEAIQLESFTEQFDPYLGRKLPNPPALSEVLSIQHLRLDKFSDVVHDMRERDTLVTNSGWPAFTKREREVPLELELSKKPFWYLRRALTYPAIILFRKYNGKLRAVWMFPLAMNLCEYRATQPIQRAITNTSKYVMPWKGFEDVKRRFTELWAIHPYAFGGDTTAMDAHMKLPQLNFVARALKGSYDDDIYYDWMRTTLLNVGKISIIVGDNAIIRDQVHGIASGSGWTQLSETIFQILMFHTFIKEHGLSLTVDDGMGIGDDYVWFFDSKPDETEIVNFWQCYGLPGKPEKQSNEDNYCTFLQRLFIKGYMSREDKQTLGGVYPTVRALNSLLWPEKFHNPKDWNSDMFCIRTYMILENCVDHPLFEEFVRFVVKGQKDLLPFAKKSATELAAIQAASRQLPGLNPSYNQEKRDKPLGAFESIKYASTL